MSCSELYRESRRIRAAQKQYENRMHRDASRRKIPFVRDVPVATRFIIHRQENWLMRIIKRIIAKIKARF